MDNKNENSNKIKTQLIPSIHNTVSLQAHLTTKDGEPIVGEEVVYKLYSIDKSFLTQYSRITNEEGLVHLTLNIKHKVYIEICYEGSEKYESNNVMTFRTKPSDDEKNVKTKHPLQVQREEKLEQKKIEEKKKNLLDFKQKQKDLESVDDDNIAIELKNVNLSFTIGSDKIDNLKEYVIRTIKRTKEKKTIFKATDDVSFKIYKGEKVGLIGFNGAGKSTLLKIISGVYTPDDGEVIVNGKIAPLLSLGAGFDKNYTGRENIFLNGAILGYNEEFLNSKYDEILEFSELGQFINLPVKNYSSGMLSKLGFSIATIVEPDILILDEVLGVGDVNFKRKSREKLNSLIESNITVLLVSHTISEIRNICEKAIWLENGKIREIGEVNDICDKYLEEAKKVSDDKTKKLKPKRF